MSMVTVTIVIGTVDLITDAISKYTIVIGTVVMYMFTGYVAVMVNVTMGVSWHDVGWSVIAHPCQYNAIFHCGQFVCAER